MKLKVLDLCSGLGGFSKAFKDAGHDVITLDYDSKFGADLTMDVIDFSKDPEFYLPKGWVPDVILAGPDCRGFSIARVWETWDAVNVEPKNATARMSVEIMDACIRTIDVLDPPMFLIENPRGMARKYIEKNHPQLHKHRKTISYCQYGSDWMKPTDLWTNIPEKEFRAMCKPGMDCHESAPRGSLGGMTGTRDPAKRAKAPEDFSKELLRIAEEVFAHGL